MAESALPSGIVTFLFTDIEGSTRLFHRLGDGYVAILDRHNKILRAVWREHGGTEVSTEGDSFLVAFGSADEAIEASVAGQLALSAAEWPGSVEIKVRMGLHSGLAAPRGGSYVSVAVNEAARIIDTAHGGQVVVSEDTKFLANAQSAFALRPLGRFRVRDFAQPVRLYQVIADGLPESFPALRATPADQHNIVPRPTATIGRKDVVSAVIDRLAARRTFTLTGPGGVGKSRVAIDVGLAIAPNWADGVWFVELAPVEQPDLVAGAVAEAIGAPLRSGGARTDDVLQHLSDRNAVVILDNCEHLVDACSRLVRQIESDCPDVAILATSRQPLRVPGEIVWPVQPLSVPSAGAELGIVEEAEAVQLFRDRAEAVRPGFAVDLSNADTIAKIVTHLDGVPLLIELAAAHLSAQSPAEVLRGIEGSLGYLKTRDPEMSDRHSTAEGLIDWSYRLLETRERATFRRLSVFASSFSHSTASIAAADGDVQSNEVEEVIWSLVEKSLVEAGFDSDDTRYRLLEAIRSYSRKLLDAAGETAAVALKLSRWFLERIGPWLPADRVWLGEVGAELDNLRALIALIPDADQELAQQIACTIGRFHDANQSFIEGVQELHRLAANLDKASPTRVALLTTLGDLYLRTGDVERAEEQVEAAAKLQEEHGSPDWDDVAVARTRGEISRRRGDLAGAAEIARKTLEGQVSERGQARMYNLLGTTSAALGDFDTAYESCQHELDLMERLGYEGYVASANGNLAEIALRLGDMEAAARHQRACLQLAVAQGSPVLVAFSLIVAARIAGWAGEWDKAVTLHAQADKQLDEIGLVLYEDDLAQSRELLDQARSELGDHGFAMSSRRGQEMALSDAVRLAEEVLTTTGGG